MDVQCSTLTSIPEVSLRARHGVNGPAVMMILLAWFEHLVESFSNKRVQFKQSCLPVKTTGTISDSAECYAGLSVRFDSSAACM